MKKLSACKVLIVAALCWGCGSVGSGQRTAQLPQDSGTPVESERSAADVAAELANPLAPITALAIQYRAEAGNGPANDTNHQIRLQPSFFKPFDDGSALLVRSILPLRSTRWPAEENGIGDLQLIPYFVPDTKAKNFIGYGGAIGFDTASEEALGAGRLTAGPALIFAATGQPLTWGGLIQHVWSVDNSSKRADVNITTLQPFATYLLGGGWAATASMEIRRDWDAPSGSGLSVPAALGASRVVEVGGVFLNLSGSYVQYIERTSFDPDWELRFGLTYVLR